MSVKSDNNQGVGSAVPESEMEFSFARSGGPGGQNVNKVSSKVILRWNVVESAVFTEQEKQVLAEVLANRINNDGQVVIYADSERSQHQNRANAIALLQKLVADALTPRKKRVPTKPSRSQKRRRIEDKRKLGEKKRGRRSPSGVWD